MVVLSFTISDDGVGAFRDALICLSKFSDDVSLEARKDSFVLSTLNSSKSAYASFKFATTKFFSRYQYHGGGQFPERRSGLDNQRDADKQTIIDRCDVVIEDGEGIESRFISRIIFKNGLTSTHRLPYEIAVPVHAKFNKQDAPHHWTISSRTLRELMEHFGPGVEYLDINTEGDHVKFTCFSEKTVSEDMVLKKPLRTTISLEIDEFDDIDVEDDLHIVITVKDFRAIIQHAGITGNDISARYSLPACPIQLAYLGDSISCEFLIMTVGDRGANPAQKTKKGRKSAPPKTAGPRLEAISRRTSVAPSEPPQPPQNQPEPAPQPAPTASLSARPQLSTARASASRSGVFDLRPTQQQAPPQATMMSESLFVDDDGGWEPMRDEDEDEEEDNARLGWDHSAEPNPPSFHLSRPPEQQQQQQKEPEAEPGLVPTADDREASFVEPTQKLSEVMNLALFPD
ncbi:unnamed protein product [Clonostachys byssicola]|uniref:DNA repair protein rad9 n=1 Tax=Clonostachys byssicola TaxID=160290 RepID=A0A9N9UQZ7_9HYPO|nr:unnamed protein product [Clonostachys byssicola]